MEVKIKKLSENAIIPVKATSGSAAYDVFLPRNYRIRPGRQVLPLDLSIELPHGYQAMIEPRSGFSAKGFEGESNPGYPCRYDADVIQGKIDSDHRGNIGVIVKSKDCFTALKGTRVAQLTIQKVEDAYFVECDQLSETERGSGGFGHTGTNKI